jgi:ATP-binding cassette, subfamily B, bacterial PglK
MIVDILTPAEKSRLLLLLPLVILSALFEVAGITSIVPLLGMVADPASIERYRYLSWAYGAFAFGSREQFMFAAGVAVLVLLTVSNAVAAAAFWGQMRFSWMRNHTISTRLLQKYLLQPYAYFLAHNTANLSANILSEVTTVAIGVIGQMLQLAARIVSVLFICAVLLVIDPWLALGVSGVFGGLYGGVYFLVRRSVTRSGVIRNAMNKQRYQVATEVLGGIKEFKLYGLEPVAIASFSRPSREYAEKQSNTMLIAHLPRYALETIAFSGILGMVIYLLRRGSAPSSVLPLVGFIAFAAYRLLPSVQTIFAGVTSLRSNLASLSALHLDLMSGPTAGPAVGAARSGEFREKIGLENVSFQYAPDLPPAIEQVSLTIAAGEWVALIGPTGSGKSTLVDLLLGLLVPTSGSLQVDGRPLDQGRAGLGWQGRVSYVPQMIFLLDDTIERNIAFGIPEADVDKERLEWAANVAQIHGFIREELPAGYQTTIGERGVRLSGGQRQRIGVARALYRRPKLLVLDEATSALDNETEAAFFKTLRAEMIDMAVVSIAHRLTTTRYFDRILILEQGRLVDEGSFQDLLARSERYRGLARHS